MRTTASRPARLALPLLLAAFCPAPGPFAEGAPSAAPAPAPAYLLGPDGTVYRWRPQAPDGLAAVDLKSVTARPIRDLARLDSRRHLLLPVPDPADRPRRRMEGRALVVVLDGPGGGPVITGSLVFEGEGVRVVAAVDGRAYLLARRRGGQGDEWLLHQADPATGKILATSLLGGEPLDLVVDPPAGRLYLGTGDRILTLTTSRLIPSWQFRSPGANRALAIRPGTNRLYVARGREVAIFDPAAAAPVEGGSHRREGDEAVEVIDLPLEAASISFHPGGRLALIRGAGASMALLDAATGTLLADPGFETLFPGAERLLPVAPSTDGAFVLAAFPGPRAGLLPAPDLPPVPTPAPPEAGAAGSRRGEETVPGLVVSLDATSIRPPTAAAAPSAATHAAPAAPRPTDPAAPGDAGPAASPAPAPSAPAEPARTGDRLLRGRITGAREGIEAVVLFGPGSIVREAARGTPEPDGNWAIPLPAPGTYRVVLRGKSGRPIASVPNFHTIEVKEAGLEGIDFSVSGGASGGGAAAGGADQEVDDQPDGQQRQERQ